MNLTEYCKLITKPSDSLSIEKDEELGLRIMCLEYAIGQVDIKTFPLSNRKDIFVLCWNISEGQKLHATIMPYENHFVYVSDISPGDKTQHHTHDYIELAYIVEGEFKQRILGYDILFEKGEVCLIDRNCSHQDLITSKDTIIIFIGLANEMFDQAMVNNIGEEKLLDFLRTALMKQKDIKQYLHFKPKNSSDKEFEDLLLQMCNELDKDDGASSYISKGLIIRILNILTTKFDFSLSRKQRKKMNWIVYEEIVRYIDENYATVTIQDLVDKFNFNENYYNRILKEKMGMTYLKYVQHVRLENAHHMLKTTDMTVDEIAEKVGYRNKGYFYKIFVKKYGVTPAKIRK